MSTNIEYNWNGVIQFLQDSQKKQLEKETEWLIEKEELKSENERLKGQLGAQENINMDLLKRIKMLEYCLRAERIKYTKLLEGKEIPESLKLFFTETQQKQAELLEVKFPQSKVKRQRPMLAKFLQELGLENILDASEISKEEDIDMPKLQESLPKSNSISVDKVEEFKYESVLMKSHLDVVRGITYIEHNENSYIASASEDCTIKLWKNNLAENKEPLMVLRGHTGPIFCISSYHSLIFSAGCEGIIKIWDVSKLKQIEPYAMLKGETGCIGNFKKHTETIWDLRINPINSMLLTVSADGYIGMWNTSIIDSFNEEEYNSNLLKHMFNAKGKIPTCASWIPTNVKLFCAGFYNSSDVCFFDIDKATVCEEIKRNKENSQVNKIISLPMQNIVLCANEDGTITILDSKSPKPVNTIDAHSKKSVNCIDVLSNGIHFVSGGDDEKLKVWDLRKFKPVAEIEANKQKFGEGVLCVAAHKTKKIFASGGGDGIVKQYEFCK